MPHEAPPLAAAPAAVAPAAPIVSLPWYAAVALPLAALAAQFVIGLALALLGISGALRATGSPVMFLLVAAALSALSYFPIVAVVLARRGWRWTDLGLGESRNGPVALAVSIGLVTAVLGTLFDGAIQGAAGSPFRLISALEFACAALVLGVLVPVSEEILFRGIVFPVLRARIGDAAAAIVVSALIFGAFHLIPSQIVVGAVLGLPLAWLRHWSGSLLPPIALHMTHNFGVVALAASGAI
jgi:membrane protease YdiL (CAAX protease family)